MTEDAPEDSGDSTAERETDAEEAQEAPFEALADRVRDRKRAASDDQTGDDMFESVEIDEVDRDAVWEDVLEESGEDASGNSTVGLGGTSVHEVTPEDAAGPTEYVVPKHTYCQRCQYFAAPPETRCMHDGTEIVEVVDFDHFRVRDCPMVGDDPDEFEPR